MVESEDFKDRNIQHCSTTDEGHGRIEKRLYYYSTDINWLDARPEWSGLKGIGMGIRRCNINGEITEERAYYISSVKTVEKFSKVRLHWGVESMHWNLDVTFCEDACKTRKGQAPQNLAALKRLALNMVRKDKERYPKKSLNKKRFIALLHTDYLEYLFDISF